jgi:hypothetical protein
MVDDDGAKQNFPIPFYPGSKYFQKKVRTNIAYFSIASTVLTWKTGFSEKQVQIYVMFW